MGGMAKLLLPLEGGAGLDLGVKDFASRPLWPGVLPDWVNNHAAQALIGAILVIGFWTWMAKGQQLVPTRKQFYGEQLYDLIRNTVARDLLGADFRKFLPYLVGIFSFILVNNLFGQFFLFMFPTFSKIGYAYGLAIMSWLLYNGAGIAKHGFLGYARMVTMPEGVPAPLYVLIIPLEFLSNIIVRPLTSLRLFANLFAATWSSWCSSWAAECCSLAGPFMKVAGGVSIAFSFAIFALELLVAAIRHTSSLCSPRSTSHRLSRTNTDPVHPLASDIEE